VTLPLAELLATARYTDLPKPVLDEARRAILDWLGSALAGSLERPARMVQSLVAGLGISSEAPCSQADAHRRAGRAGQWVASHILEFDDVHKGSTLHAAAPVIPAPLP